MPPSAAGQLSFQLAEFHWPRVAGFEPAFRRRSEKRAGGGDLLAGGEPVEDGK